MKNQLGRYAIFTALEGRGKELARVLASDTGAMKETGALVYTVGIDEQNVDSVHVYALWSSEADKAASFSHPMVAETVARARQLIVGPPNSKNIIVIDPKVAKNM